MNSVACWFLLPSGAVSGCWIVLPWSAATREHAFATVIETAMDLGAVSIWCEPYELPPGFRPERVLYEVRKRKDR